jgi:hypothetical protein
LLVYFGHQDICWAQGNKENQGNIIVGPTLNVMSKILQKMRRLLEILFLSIFCYLSFVGRMLRLVFIREERPTIKYKDHEVVFFSIKDLIFYSRFTGQLSFDREHGNEEKITEGKKITESQALHVISWFHLLSGP